jgi:hypothetical protein
MRRFAVLAVISLVVASCSPDAEVTGSTSKCATDLDPSYNSKVLSQCVAVCIKCDYGSTITCSTSCEAKDGRALPPIRHEAEARETEKHHCPG